MGGIPLNYEKCYFFFSGYYAVAAASEALEKYHINNRIVRAPVFMKNSCNFALLVNSVDADMSSYVLERENIRINKKEYV